MRLTDKHIKWVMLVAGALTCTTAYAFIAREAGVDVHLRYWTLIAPTTKSSP